MLFLWATASFAATLPTVPAFEGATYQVLDPTAIPKYVQPLVIPPMMPPSDDPMPDSTFYNIAMRQFNQQILPGGIWNTVNGRNDKFPATTVFSYGKAEDDFNLSYTAPMPLSNPKATTFNYPALTVEATQNQLTRVRWINELYDPKTGKYLKHLTAVDRTSALGQSGTIGMQGRHRCAYRLPAGRFKRQFTPATLQRTCSHGDPRARGTCQSGERRIP